MGIINKVIGLGHGQPGPAHPTAHRGEAGGGGAKARKPPLQRIQGHQGSAAGNRQLVSAPLRRGAGPRPGSGGDHERRDEHGDDALFLGGLAVLEAWIILGVGDVDGLAGEHLAVHLAVLQVNGAFAEILF